MTNWTPSTIHQLASEIAELAQSIDGQLWWASKYEVGEREAYNLDLHRKSRELQLKIAEFKNTDTDMILFELKEALK